MLLRVMLAILLTGPTIPSADAADRGAPVSRSIDVDGSRIWFETEGSGPPIVFLHGGLQSYESNFVGQRAAFASFRTVIGIDQRGHGHSPDTGEPFSYRRMADDTAAVIASLGLGPVDLVGESDGADVALLLAHDHPTLVRTLVLASANLRSGLPADEVERRSHWSDAQVVEAARALERNLPPSFRTTYEATSPDGAGHWPVHLLKSYRLWMTPVILDASSLKAITVPALVVAGDHDFVSIEETTEIFRGLPNGQLLIVPATGHGTFEARPSFMNAAVRQFLEGAAPK